MVKPKNILITGCSSGIGLCCAEKLKARGHNVFATARKKHDIECLTNLNIHALTLDVDDSKSIKKTVSALFERIHTLDVLVNNCSYAQAGAVEDLTRDTIRSQFETNLFGPLELTNLVLKHMRNQGHGLIIQIGSLLGYVSMPFRGAYVASKFALEGISATLRQELYGTNINLSIIAPGPIKTAIRENAKNKFLNHIKIENSINKEYYEHQLRSFFNNKKHRRFCLHPEAVYKKVVHAIESRKPKPRYYVGFPSYFYMLAARLLPTCLLDKIMRLTLAGEDK